MARLNWNTLGGGRGKLPRETWEPDGHAFTPTPRQPVERSKTHPTEGERRRQEAKEVRERLRALSERLRDEQPERLTKSAPPGRRRRAASRHRDTAAPTTSPRRTAQTGRVVAAPRRAKAIRGELLAHLHECRVSEGQLATHARCEPVQPQVERGKPLWTALKGKQRLLNRLAAACARVGALIEEGRRVIALTGGSPALADTLSHAVVLHARYSAALRRHQGGAA
jgi:hypothetical protein